MTEKENFLNGKVDHGNLNTLILFVSLNQKSTFLAGICFYPNKHFEVRKPTEPSHSTCFEFFFSRHIRI